jgi:hypothetical protein
MPYLTPTQDHIAARLHQIADAFDGTLINPDFEQSTLFAAMGQTLETATPFLLSLFTTQPLSFRSRQMTVTNAQHDQINRGLIDIANTYPSAKQRDARDWAGFFAALAALAQALLPIIVPLFKQPVTPDK